MPRILIECSECRARKPLKTQTCGGRFRYGERRGERCEADLRKQRFAVYWVEIDVPAELSETRGQRNGAKAHKLRHRKLERVGASRKAAEKRLHELLIQISEARVIRRDRNASVTLHQLLTWYFDQPETRERHSSTLRRYQTAAQSLRRLLPDVLVRDLRPQHIQDYVRARRDEGCAPATVKFEVSVLKIIFQRGVRHDFLSEVPIRNWPVIEVRNERDRTLTDAEWARLRAALSPRLRPIVELAWHTGMRQGEILGLEWNQVDLQSGFIRLRADQTKTKRARSVFLCAEAVNVLRSVPRDIRCVHRVFVNTEGRPLTRSACAMTHDWRAALAAAGIEDFVFHDLRHAYISRARLSGVPDFLIRRQVGHSGAAMTERYTSVEERDLLRLAQVN